MNALGRFVKFAAPAESLALLIPIMDDEAPDMRGMAARELGDLGSAASDAVPALIKMLADKEYRVHGISADFSTIRAVRFDAAEALGRIGPRSQAAMPLLRKAADTDEDPEVRVSAALALLRIDTKDDAPLRLLIAALGNDEQGTAGPECAADALQQLGARAKPALQALVAATNNKYEFVRMSAIDAIVAIDGEAAIDVLRGCLDDEDFQVRETASAALGTLGPLAAPAVPDLVLALADGDEEYNLFRESLIRAIIYFTHHST